MATLQTRIALKYDTYSNWLDVSQENCGGNLILLRGEIGICEYDSNEGTSEVLFKIGDGKRPFIELPWAAASAADVESWAKASDVVIDETSKAIKFIKANIDGTDKVLKINYITPEEVKAITDVLESDLGKVSQRTSVIEETIEGIESNLSLKANASDVYAKTESYSSTVIDNKVAELTAIDDLKLDAAPNGIDSLVDSNNKLNLKYMPDTVLGQLIYGGIGSLNTISETHTNPDGSIMSFPAAGGGTESGGPNAQGPYIDIILTDNAITKIKSSLIAKDITDITDRIWVGIRLRTASFSVYYRSVDNSDNLENTTYNRELFSVLESIYFVMQTGYGVYDPYESDPDRAGSMYIIVDLKSLTLDTTEVSTGDWLLLQNNTFAKVDNTDAVQSVAGKTGAVTLKTTDITDLPDRLATIQSDITSVRSTADANANALTSKLDKTPNGVDLLVNANNKINLSYIPDSILGQLMFGGTALLFNYEDSNHSIQVTLTSDAKEKLNITDNTVVIYEDDDFTQYQGLYFIASTGGRNNSVTFCGLDILVGDWLVATAGGWQKIDNTDSVTSVAGKTGSVSLTPDDITNLPETLSALQGAINDVSVDANSKAAQKLDLAPDGSVTLIDSNNKINLTYIPDSILGQLVYGGTAAMYDYSNGSASASESARYFGLSFTASAQEKLGTADTYRTIYSSESALPYEGLYFIAATGRNSSVTFNSLDFQVGDWLVATQAGWKKIDNTDAVQSVAGKTGAVTLAVADINGLRDELDVKVPFTKASDTTSVVCTFSDNENNVALSLEDTDTTKSKYFFKAFNNPTTNNLENFYIQYYQGAETGIYETVLGVEKNSTYNEMQVHFRPTREEALCELNTEYVDSGTVYYYRNNDSCAVTVYIHVKNCVNEWSDNDAIPHGHHIATLPEGVNTFGAYYGTVVSQADGTPHPGQTYLIKIIGNKVYLVTKGYSIDSSWIIGSAFFFKLP